mgnify:CR=1 FL=1
MFMTLLDCRAFRKLEEDPYLPHAIAFAIVSRTQGDGRYSSLQAKEDLKKQILSILRGEQEPNKGEVEGRRKIPSVTGDIDIDFIIDIQNQNLKEAWREDKSAYSMENDDMRYMSFLAKQERVGDLKRGNLVART